jgi:NTE family protein
VSDATLQRGASPAQRAAAQLNRNGRPTPPAGRVGLCLSGGGYRAMLFHLGVLWRLNETGWLRRLDEISSVSGGAITAAALGVAWRELSFNERGVAPDFAARVAAPLRDLASRRVDLAAVLAGLLIPGVTSGQRVAAAYRKRLFGRATLQDLPERPRFIFNATNIASGALVRFSKRYVADWRVGRIERPEFELAAVVACSSAYPPVLGPYRLSLRGQRWITEAGNDLTSREYRDRWLLSDGGVYDNLGLETAWKRCRTLFVSDAGGQIEAKARPAEDWARHLIRTLGVIDNQVRSLRTRQTIEGFRRGEREGFYIGIRGDISRYPVRGALSAPKELTSELAGIRTRLAPLESRTQERLINWGYAICDAGLRRRVDPAAPPPSSFPYPEAGVG